MSFFIFLKKIVPLIVTATMLLGMMALSTYAKENDNATMQFDCKSAILMEAKTGTVLYEFNADEALPPASVTKIMTLLLIMEEIEKGTLKYTDTITTSANAASMGGSQIFLKEGEQMSAEDMIKSVVIASANDAAVALAEHICGSEEIFVSRMNQKARELDMKNTNFENTNGLDDTATNHKTSARDIALMSRELIKHEDILRFSSTWMDTIRNGEFGLTNTNRLVRFYQGATGLKTGSTSKAKFCVSATAKRDNMHLICVIMGAPSSDVRNSIATQLLNWGFANFELYEDSAARLDPIKVCGGREDLCQIETDDFAIVLKRGEASRIVRRVNIPQKISAPVGINDKVGRVEYYLGKELVGENDVVSSIGIKKIDYWSLFVRILSKFLIK